MFKLVKTIEDLDGQYNYYIYSKNNEFLVTFAPLSERGKRYNMTKEYISRDINILGLYESLASAIKAIKDFECVSFDTWFY